MQVTDTKSEKKSSKKVMNAMTARLGQIEKINGATFVALI